MTLANPVRSDAVPLVVREQGLFAAIIRRESAATNRNLSALLEGEITPEQALVTLATNLLRLLTGERSLAINRAAMMSPDLARLLLQHGRRTTGPLVERYLARLADQEMISVGRSRRGLPAVL